MVLKRTSPGPKIGPTGNTMGGAAKKIGTSGPDKPFASSAGGQYPFMPTPKKIQGTAKESAGQVASGRVNDYDFLPKKSGHGTGATTKPRRGVSD